eukprot:COSAG04_NODE_1117_length_8197_cov_19.090258_2_plen_87_part_00
MNGFIGDRLQEGDPTPFFESIEQAESFKSQGIAYSGKIAFVHVAGKAASGAVEETGCERPPLPPPPPKTTRALNLLDFTPLQTPAR